MVSSEVQRTLVKSPPELWAELGDPAALARHLGELGEIRIVKTKPEERVEWAADGATGTVLIKASGWGTKVTLSVTRELYISKDEPAPADPDAAAEPEAGAETEPIAEPAPSEPVPVAPEPAGIAAATPEPTLEAEPTTPGSAPASTAADPISTPERRRGFFARLFGRRKPASPESSEPASEISAPSSEAASAPAWETAVEHRPPTSEAKSGTSAIQSLQARFQPEESEQTPPTLSGPEPEQPARHTESAADIAAELEAAEEVAAEEVAAVLSAVLDRLGAAHHRPFSRS